MNEAPSTTVFRLLDLPAELQIQILAYAVAEDKPIVIGVAVGDMESNEYKLWCQPSAVRNRIQPAITRTSRKIRYDSLKLYYETNDFEANFCHIGNTGGITHDMPVMRWLTAIGAEHRGQIRNLHIFDEAWTGGLGNICFDHWKGASRDLVVATVPVDETMSRYEVLFLEVAEKSKTTQVHHT